MRPSNRSNNMAHDDGYRLSYHGMDESRDDRIWTSWGDAGDLQGRDFGDLRGLWRGGAGLDDEKRRIFCGVTWIVAYQEIVSWHGALICH